MVRTMPFTGFTHFLGTPPYFTFPNPQPPSVRAAAPPPVVAPSRGLWGWTKAALPPAVTSSYQSAALTPQGPLTYTS